MDVDEFKRILETESERNIVQRYIIDAPCAELDDDVHFQKKTEIANFFALNPRDIVVVGSAKLGFSIAPTKRYQAFHFHSDVDIAIVSSNLFDDFWQQAFLYSEGGAHWGDKVKFFQKVSQGWIRPDLMPRDSGYGRRKEWWDFFAPMRARTKFGPVKVRAGLYKNWSFLEAYQARSIAKCKEAQ